ncbi:hypothetical protein V3Q90_00035 [Flavobacterium oreochromis]|uniref:hypothetical protein n=1 Tax=Flavobacterium oreochromis TaxID=2906078 RepID=UPI00385890CA
MWGKLLRSLFLLLSFSSIAQTITDIQIQNARATGYAIIAAKNPGVRFSVMVIPWDKEKTLEQNANNQINPYWHAQCAVKGNYFDQPFDGANFSAYSSVVTSQEEFDLYKSTGTQWWIVCSTLPAFSVGAGESFSTAYTITSYSPLLTLKRDTNTGGYIQGIQSKLADGTNNWYFGNWDADKWVVSKGDYSKPLFMIRDNGNIGIGSNDFFQKLNINGGIGFTNFNSFDKKLYSPDDGTLEWMTHDWAAMPAFAVSHQGNKRILLSVKGNSYINTNGNVGIGTATPLATLDVNGNGIFNQRDSDYTHIRLGHNINDNIISDNSSSKYYGGGYFFRVHNETIPHKYIDALFLGENGNIGVGAKALNHKFEVSGNASINGILFVQGADLKLGMGDGRDQGTLVEQRALVHGSADQLWVNYGGDFEGGTKIGNGIILKNSGDSAFQGKIEAKELKVTTTPTADFVFDERYDLPKLETVEKHIKEKKHLPEVASAKEMEKNGVNVGDFQIKLLQKIEELTLYVIEQNKKIQALQTEIKELKK